MIDVWGQQLDPASVPLDRVTPRALAQYRQECGGEGGDAQVAATILTFGVRVGVLALAQRVRTEHFVAELNFGWVIGINSERRAALWRRRRYRRAPPFGGRPIPDWPDGGDAE